MRAMNVENDAALHRFLVRLHVRTHGWHVVPTCPYVRRWLAKHPEHKDLIVACADAV